MVISSWCRATTRSALTSGAGRAPNSNGTARHDQLLLPGVWQADSQDVGRPRPEVVLGPLPQKPLQRAVHRLRRADEWLRWTRPKRARVLRVLPSRAPEDQPRLPAGTVSDPARPGPVDRPA